MLNYSKKSWHARLYLSTLCKEELPENLCPYFWTVMWCVIVFPLYIPTHLVNIIFKKPKWARWVFIAMWLCWWVMRGAWWLFIILIVGSVIIFGLLFLIDRTTRDTIVSDKVKSFKGKYCPKINWN